MIRTALGHTAQRIRAIALEGKSVQQPLEPANGLVMGGERVARHQVDDGDIRVQLMQAQRVVAAEVAPIISGTTTR